MELNSFATNYLHFPRTISFTFQLFHQNIPQCFYLRALWSMTVFLSSDFPFIGAAQSTVAASVVATRQQGGPSALCRNLFA